jgi:transcriptional regulator with XRE-family HTH domain
MGFRENLKSELQFANMPVKELSARSGVKKGTLDSYLAVNGYTPSATAAVSIAKALGVSVEYLVEGKEGGKSRPLAALPQDIQDIVQAAEQLNTKDRQVVLTLANTLRKR